MTPKSTTWFPAGFILLFGLTFFLALAARASPGDTLYVQSKSVNVYEVPSANAPVVMQVVQGQKLKEFRRQGEWVKVIIYGEVGKEGWIEGSFVGLKSLADTTAESQEPAEILGRGNAATRTFTPGGTSAESRSLLHKFVVRVRGSGRIKGHCRYKTANGAVRRFRFLRSRQITAKAIKCDVSSPSVQARLRVELWGDGKLLRTATIGSGSRVKSIPCGGNLRGPYGMVLPRTCAQSTRRQLSAYW